MGDRKVCATAPKSRKRPVNCWVSSHRSSTALPTARWSSEHGIIFTRATSSRLCSLTGCPRRLIYTRETANIDEESATQAVSAVLRYLSRVGVVKYTCHSGYLSTVINENELATVLTPAGGIFRALRVPGQEVEYGDTIGEILDPFTAEIVAPVTATTSGLVFFAIDKPLVLEHEVAFKLIRRLHA